MSDVKISVRSVAAFTGNDDKDSWLWDSTIKGFGIKVSKAGRKTFVYKFRSEDGRQRKRKIGDVGSMTPEQARKEAQRLSASLAFGKDIVKTKPTETDMMLVSAFCDMYLSDYARLHKKPKSVEDDERMIRLVVKPKLGWLLLKDVQRRDVAALHRNYHATPYKANRLVGLLSKMFNLAEEWDYRQDGSNPCRHIHKYKEIPRERFLSEDEIRHLSKIIDKAEYERFVSQSVINAIRLLMMTGCRLSEITTLKWEYIDFQKSCIKLPDSKSGKKTVWLGKNALEYIEGIERKPNNPYVITGQRKGSYLINIQKPWRALRGLAGLDDVRIHDLRHTFASLAVSQNLSLTIVGALLGHKSSKSTERYAHLYTDVMEQAAALTASKMEEITMGS